MEVPQCQCWATSLIQRARLAHVIVCRAMLCCAEQEAAEWTGDERVHSSAAVQQTGGLRWVCSHYGRNRYNRDCK